MGINSIFLPSLWKSCPSFKTQRSLYLLQEALPDGLAGHEVGTMEENRGKEKGTTDEEMAWEPEIRARLMQPDFS